MSRDARGPPYVISVLDLGVASSSSLHLEGANKQREPGSFNWIWKFNQDACSWILILIRPWSINARESQIFQSGCFVLLFQRNPDHLSADRSASVFTGSGLGHLVFATGGAGGDPYLLFILLYLNCMIVTTGLSTSMWSRWWWILWSPGGDAAVWIR